MKICFATNNEGKRKEIVAITQGLYEIVNLKDIGCEEELPENQDTLEGNSKEKASYVFQNYGINCFADDTGLEVYALQGEPGVYSARYAGPACNAEDNMDLLLSKLSGIEDRRAAFRTVITLIVNGAVYQFEGKVDGSITQKREGKAGFGYDPVFIPDGYKQTFASLSAEEKNKISHRGIAVRKLSEFLLTKYHA